jgi:hypothetical protein
MAKIIIESNGDTTFRFKKYPDEEFQIKAKIFEIKKIENSSEVYTVKATQANTGELLFSEKISDITVDGAVYTNYEDLSEVLTPLLFKKGGGSGGGGTGGTVNVTSPITGDGDATPIGILPASSSNRGTISSSDFNKLAAFQAASNYALLTDITALDGSLKTWVTNKNYATQSFVATNYALKTDLTDLDASLKTWVIDKGYATTSNIVANYYNKTEIDSKISSVYKAKGNVANFAALPASGNVFGDVYNVIDTGNNYAWIDNLNNSGVPGWDRLSGIVDLSTYYTISETEAAILAKGYATTSALNTGLNSKENTVSLGLNTQYYRGDKTWQTLNKTAVGLSAVDNTSDASKPVSTAQQTEFDKKENLANKVVAFGATPTDTQYPSAKLVKDTIDNINTNATTKLDKIITTPQSVASNITFSGLITYNAANTIDINRVVVKDSSNIIRGAEAVEIIGDDGTTTPYLNEAALDVAYPLVVSGFELICPNISTTNFPNGLIYKKTTIGWRVERLYLLSEI